MRLELRTFATPARIATLLAALVLLAALAVAAAAPAGAVRIDLQVLVHDGEPRRTGRQPELCWVRIVGAEQGPPRRFIFMTEATTLTKSEFARKYQTNEMVYVATLLNAPHGLQMAERKHYPVMNGSPRY